MAPASSSKGRLAVAFDSSFLLAVMDRPTTWREDILEKVGAFTPVLLGSVRDELGRLAHEGGKKGRLSALALAFAEENGFSHVEDGGGRPDDELISFALRGAGVATLDSELLERLRASKAKTLITLRGGRVSV